VTRARSTMFGRKDHGYCCWCKRPLVSSQSDCGQAFTFDHVVAKALGGQRRVPCCRDCNVLKADLPFADWCWFIDHHRRWWKAFSSPDQVRLTIVAERSRRAFAGEPPLSPYLIGSPVMSMRAYQ
jgi:hypothetical protein